ncbi:hypothetical protein PCK1_002945 [Pneumocystis canis]|nr:hypothetical protein PCK1_002945 [Pneumocystis canis]
MNMNPIPSKSNSMESCKTTSNNLKNYGRTMDSPEKTSLLDVVLNNMFLNNMILVKSFCPNFHDHYEEIFNNSGFFTIFLPVLKCSFIHQESLKNLLKNRPYMTFSALLFTSQNAVCAFKESLMCIDKHEFKQILHMTVYTVGPATYHTLQSLGFHKIYGKESGNAEMLLNFILSFHIDKKPILFLTGEKRINILEKKLLLSGIFLKVFIVYKTEESNDFKHLFNEIINNQTLNIHWIVFFSPYGSNIVMKYIPTTYLSRFKIATIGPTTLQHLNSKWNIKAKVITQHPEPNSLLEAIMNYEKDHPQD